MSAQVRFDDTINAHSTIALFKQLARAYPCAKRIIVICDSARYDKSRLVGEYLESSPIVLLMLPPYCRNLNLIERFWKLFEKQVLYNRYDETFRKFENACEGFFANLDQHARHPAKLLAENV